MTDSPQHLEQQAGSLLLAVLVSLLLHLLLLNLAPSPASDPRPRLALTASLGNKALAPPPSPAKTRGRHVLDPTQFEKPAELPTTLTTPPEHILPAEDSLSGEIPAGAGSLPAILPVYYPPSRLQKRPSPLSRLPEFSVLRLQGSDSGRLVIQLFISAEGIVDKLVVETADVSDELIAFVYEAFSSALYSPGMIEDTPVPSQIRFEVNIEPM